MKISDILNLIDLGNMALPEFQRGYVWNREQVRNLFGSLYRRYPVGGLLVWSTASKTAAHRGQGPLGAGIIELLLDGQQRMTSLYGVIRGKPPRFFDGNAQAFTGLRFHLDTETFAFYQPLKMQDDPRWIDVTALMKAGMAGVGPIIAQFTHDTKALEAYFGRLGQLLGILDVDLHIEKVTGTDKTLDVVVEIFNRVNGAGTKLSKGDLALARVCADWPQARETMKTHLARWSAAGFHFNLDWLLRCVNTVLTGEAKFQYLHDHAADDIADALARAVKQIDACLNLIGGRLGLDHDQVLFGRFGIPVMVRYLDRQPGPLDAKSRDKLLFWFAQAGMWGRFSGSTETVIDQDLAALEGPEGGLDRLLEQLRLWHGGLRAEPGHFTGWSLGARFYPVLYLLTRMGAARDWGTGLPLKASLLGKLNRLEVHHIFPKSRLYKLGYKRAEVNALANFCFLTKDTNLTIGNRLPEAYFPEVEAAHPGALASQWIPADPDLWKVGRFPDFLEARKALLAAELNHRLAELLHDEPHWLAGHAAPVPLQPPAVDEGGLADEDEGNALEDLNDWMERQGLPRGLPSWELLDSETGEPRAILDLAWPDGVQESLSQPVALLPSAERELLAYASQAGFRCFTRIADFRRSVEAEVLNPDA